jgi:hypothetical protein
MIITLRLRFRSIFIQNYTTNTHPKFCWRFVGQSARRVLRFLRPNREHKAESRHYQTARFKVTHKSCNVATRTAEPRRVKTAQNLQHSKTSSSVLLPYSRAVRCVCACVRACNPTVALKHAIWWWLLQSYPNNYCIINNCNFSHHVFLITKVM